MIKNLFLIILVHQKKFVASKKVEKNVIFLQAKTSPSNNLLKWPIKSTDQPRSTKSEIRKMMTILIHQNRFSCGCGWFFSVNEFINDIQQQIKRPKVKNQQINQSQSNQQTNHIILIASFEKCRLFKVRIIIIIFFEFENDFMVFTIVIIIIQPASSFWIIDSNEIWLTCGCSPVRCDESKRTHSKKKTKQKTNTDRTMDWMMYAVFFSGNSKNHHHWRWKNLTIDIVATYIYLIGSL